MLHKTVPEEFEKNSSCASSRDIPMEDDVIRLQIKQSFIDKVRQLWDSVRISFFVIGTAITVFVAARNSMTWHLQKFWGASGDYWQSLWHPIHKYFEGDDLALAFVGVFGVCNAVFWILNLFFIILDLTGKPSFFLKYKIQDKQKSQITWRRFLKVLIVVIFNQTAVGIPFMYCMFHVMKWRGCSFGAELPTFHWVLVELIMFSIVEEVMFYYSHRMFHLPIFYRHIHKLHHEWTAPIGVASIYAHPVEHIIANILPPVVGPLLMGSHIATAIMWFSLALASTTVSHCGYHLPFLPSPEAHDFHHQKFTNNFGMLGILDRLHGTDQLFRASKAYERHTMLLGFVPLSQQIPNAPKKYILDEDEQYVDSD